MKYWSVCVVPVILGTLGLVAFAAEKPPEDYQKAMKDLSAFSQGVPKAAAAADFDGVAKLAESAKSALSVVQAYWLKRTDPSAGAAATTAQSGVKFAADLGVVAGLKSREGVEYSAKLITDSCAGCHTAHREKAADGSCEIK